MAENAPSERLITSRHRAWERLRLATGAAAFVTLLIFSTGGNPLPDARASLKTLRKSAGNDLRARRLAGRGPAYDRRFFQLVLAARDALPPGSSGVALYAPGIPEWGGRYLAIYELAPVPVVSAPSRVPPGWVSVVYGSNWPAGLRLVRPLPGGALLAPAP